METDEDYAAQSYPIEFQSGIPSPRIIPPAPDELYAHVRANMRGLERVTVKIWDGGKRYGHVNGVKVGAKYDEQPTATVDQVCRAIMAIGQDHFETIDQPCKFMVQCWVHTKATGDAKRRTTHFEIGSMDGGYGGDPYVTHTSAPENIDDVLLSHIRECHSKIFDLCDTVSGLGKSAIENAGQVFTERQRALDAQHEAQAALMAIQQQGDESRASQAKWDRGFKVLEKAINTGVAQALAAKAAGSLGVDLPGMSSPTPDTSAALPTARPAWAAPSSPAPESPSEESQTPHDFPVGYGRRAQAEPVVDTTATTDADDSDPTEDEDLFDDSPLLAGKKLYSSITAKQWPKLLKLLTKKQAEQIETLDSSETDKQTLAAVAEFRAGLKEATLKKLSGVLGVMQIAAILQLAGQAEDADDE